MERERPKIDRYPTHLFMTAYAARLDKATGELATSELAAFILPRALITIRKDDGLDIGKVVDRWDANPDLARHGVGYLLHGLLDYIVDGHFETVQSLDDEVEGLEDALFSPSTPMDLQVQQRSFELRKSLVLLRRVVLPMREVLNTMIRRDLHHVDEEMMPYYQDVYDHVLRATEWTESLRDLVTTILETNLTIQGNRMNVITKKVTSWAAIIAVPTFITGFYGMNVPYPGFSDHVGFLVATVIMVGSGVPAVLGLPPQRLAVSAPWPPGLRCATADDLPAIRAVINAAYARYLTRMDKPPAPMLRDYGPSVEAGTTWVTGSPVAAVLTLYPREDHLYVENIAVDPSAQGRGLGRALMEFAEQEAARRRLRRMALVTHETMTENQAIYARLGYIEIDRRTEDGYRRIYMEKPLTG